MGLTHAPVYRHTVFIIISKVGLIAFPCGESYRGAIDPAGNKTEIKMLIIQKMSHICSVFFVCVQETELMDQRTFELPKGLV